MKPVLGGVGNVAPLHYCTGTDSIKPSLLFSCLWCVSCFQRVFVQSLFYALFRYIPYETHTIACCCCVVALGPRETAMIMSGRSDNLTILFVDTLRADFTSQLKLRVTKPLFILP